MMNLKCSLSLVATVGLMCATSLCAQSRELKYRWFYAAMDAGNLESVARITALFPRAAAAGYNGILWNGIDGHNRSSAYADAVRGFQKTAAAYGLEVIPAILAYNDSSILKIDPNLAEGLPVKDALFVVHGSEALQEPDHAVAITNGGFETATDDVFGGWQLQDSPGVSTFVDHEVAHTGKASARVEHLPKSEYGRARFHQAIKVKPFRQYHITVWVKTQDYHGGAEMLVIAPTEKQRDLADVNVNVKPTQDWTRCDLLLNSLDFSEVHLYLIAGGGGEGRLWWDDVTISETGLLNPLRRDGTPLTVKGEDGTLFEEGRDFTSIRDPELAIRPTYHKPVAIRLTPGSRIKDGTRLRVSYYHPLFLDGYVVSCVSEPKVWEILREEFEGVNDLLHPRIFFMYDDEIRIANWDPSCQNRRMTPGQMLADKVRRCVKMIKDARPDAEIWDWSDMFDPMENAVGDYYAVNGSWAGSWEGVAPDVGIINWANDLQGKNLKWFAERGHKQILAGYYDGDGYPIAKWLQAGEGLPGIVGAMYTTWLDHYNDLESFAQEAWGGSARAPK